MSDKIKTLSVAMRLGATFRPQGFGPNPGGLISCALEAASEALTGPIARGNFYSTLASRFPRLTEISKCPGCAMPEERMYICWHLNDDHSWSREQIADWLESEGM